MTTIRRINVSRIDGNEANATDTNEIRPFGEIAVYIDTSTNPDKLVLMMFDGTRTHLKSKVLSPGVLFGSNADSGDGNNYDTIKLIPDATLHNNGSDQYIVVDPTAGEPGHIHIRAGGTQDASGADLFLGGEQTFVRVSDTYNDVVIRTSTLGEGVTPHTWDFDNTGNLTFPDGTATTGSTVIAPGVYDMQSIGNTVIQTSANAGAKTWNFGTNGSITFPDSTIQETAWSGGRVVSVPGISIGAAGDKQGDLAFNGSYIYYCTQDFVEASYSSTIGFTYSGEFPSIVKGSIPQPQAGWVLIYNGDAYTLAANATEGNPGFWGLQLTSSISVTIGDSVTIGPASVANIWKRIAWSGDTW